MKRTPFLLVLLALLACGTLVAADAKPNFSGKWVLDVQKSEFAGMPPPESQTKTIEHQDPKLRLITVTRMAQGEQRYEGNYTTDGKENVNHLGETPMKSRTHWEGKLLLTETQVQSDGGPVTINDVWELTEDGKQMVQMREYKSSEGSSTQRLFYNKE